VCNVKSGLVEGGKTKGLARQETYILFLIARYTHKNVPIQVLMFFLLSHTWQIFNQWYDKFRGAGV
jgi:hypothetical protein